MITKLFKKKAITALALGSALAIAAIACGSDNSGEPAAGGNGPDGTSSVPTPPPSSVQSGYDDVKQALETNGAVVVQTGEEPDGLFSSAVIKVLINGEQLQVYEFASTSAADTATTTVSADGTTFTSNDSPPIAIDFLHRPHLFQQGNVIVVYTGNDAGVINLLRDTLGEEFAGDKSPIDPGNTNNPGYETVLAPAPIESVEVMEDPDNPGFFILQVTSGLPNGCATFDDWKVEQTGELELTLTILNRVPAPGELIACTEIYGLVNHTIPLGSAADNLDVCELYTVRWQSRGNDESLSFQVTAPNVRCADPGTPSGGGGPIVAPIISDLDALIFGLQAMNIDIERSSEEGSELFGIPSSVVRINGERVDIFSFGPGDGSLKAAAGVSPDGSEVNMGNGTVVNLMWISQPHFYLGGNAIILYVGVDEGIISGLDAAAGQKFAGPNSEPIELPENPPVPLPVPGDSEVAIVPAPIVSVGNIVVAESFPPQYFVQVTSAQPNGCDRDAGWEVETDGNDIFVKVLNSQPADLSVVLCVAIYGETQHNVALGSDGFLSGDEYNLYVNGKLQETFTAQ